MLFFFRVDIYEQRSEFEFIDFKGHNPPGRADSGMITKIANTDALDSHFT